MKAVKINIDEDELSKIDLLISELQRCTQIKASRSAVVASIFRNGLVFYGDASIMSRGIDDAIAAE
tara:strand:- start:213 stop:410 length:198 start_codon:yes stop_codon:yes gene_type:complete